ncbi:Mob1/phocein, partial [Dioszegia hungarica]
LSAIDGPFQLAEYLALKIRADPHDVAGLVEVPAEGRSTDRDVWIYEHLSRRLPIDLTPLVSQLLSHCTKESCPEMKADQWQYLCVAHGSGVSEECSAIDYILHTLDSATAILNSTKNFPSRMSIPPGSLSHFPSLSRRLSRIFSHAYFHHREQFLISESETSLYARFVALCEAYGLVGKELLIIPNLGKAEEASEDEEDDEAGDMEEEDEADE